MKKPALALFAMLVLTGSFQTASAASSAQAFIDWDNMSFKLVDYSNGVNAPTLTWSSVNGTVTSSATTMDPNDSGSGNQSRTNFTTALSSETETLLAQSSATRNSSGMYASASSQQGASVVGVNLGTNSASSSASNSGNFQLAGNGLLLISMDWYTYSSGSTGSFYFDPAEWASASISINGSYNGQFNSGSASASYTTAPYLWNSYGPEYQSSTFVMAVFNPGLGVISGSLSATASASAKSLAYADGLTILPVNLNASPVPLPASVWLFGSALFGFLAPRKRKPNVAI